MANRIDRAAAEIQAELRPTQDPTLMELAKSNRFLAKAALIKAARAGDAEDIGEWDSEQDDDHDEWDEEEDEDQDPDNPDLGSGVDNLKGTVGSPKKGRTEKSRRNKKAEDAEDELVRAKLRLKKAERMEREADDDEDDEKLEEARKSRAAAEHALNRARGKLRRAKPAWAGDEAEFDDARKKRSDDFEDVYADGEDSYYTNEDANHEEDELVPPDGPGVADGDDTDAYTIGAHKVRSQRAMKRSQRGIPSKEALYKSAAEDGRITEDLLDAAPALEALVELLGDQQDYLAKSFRGQAQTDKMVRMLAQGMVTQNRVIAKLAKSVDAMASQPQVQNTPWGMSPQLGILAGGKSTKSQRLAKSRADLLSDAEDAMGAGQLDGETFQAMGRVQTPEEIIALAPAPLRNALGWK